MNTTKRSLRVLLATVGTRGDVQPMLALAGALRRAGHRPMLAAPAFAADEARAFDVPFAPVGIDVRRWLDEHKRELTGPLAFARLVLPTMRDDLRAQVEGLVPLAAQADIVVGAGITLGAATAAESARIPLRFICFSPQMSPSAYHPPMAVPLHGLPRPLNRLLWRAFGAWAHRILGPTFNAARARLDLPAVRDMFEHGQKLHGRMLLAADPELAPPKPDQDLDVLGSFALADERPLPTALQSFLDAGDAPIYFGFGSMSDETPRQTARIVSAAARTARCRVVLSAGWAGIDDDALGDHVHVVGPVSHWRLFPQVAGAVHHGGAGTTAAAARAGIPQAIVPHIADQFGYARQVHAQGFGPSPLARARLTEDALATRFTDLVTNRQMQRAAAAAGERVRARAPLESAVSRLEAAVAGEPCAAQNTPTAQ